MNDKAYFKNADIYSLAVVLYELFFSKMLFTGNIVEKLKKNQDEGDYVIPKGFQVSREFLDFICQCLLK